MHAVEEWDFSQLEIKKASGKIWTVNLFHITLVKSLNPSGSLVDDIISIIAFTSEPYLNSGYLFCPRYNHIIYTYNFAK